MMRLGLVALSIISFWLIVFLILVYNMGFYLKVQLPFLEGRINFEKSSVGSMMYQDVERQINDLNSALAQIDRVRGSGSLNFSEILRKFAGIVPEGISFTSLSYQGDAISISGHANTRAEALLLKSALEKDSLCLRLNSPVLVKEINIDFSFSCIVEQVKQVE